MIRPPWTEERLVPPHSVFPLPRPVLLLMMMVVGYPRFKKPKVLLPDCLSSLWWSSSVILLLVVLIQLVFVGGSRTFVSANENEYIS